VDSALLFETSSALVTLLTPDYGRPPATFHLISEVTWPIDTKLCHKFGGKPDF